MAFNHLHFNFIFLQRTELPRDRPFCEVRPYDFAREFYQTGEPVGPPPSSGVNINVLDRSKSMLSAQDMGECRKDESGDFGPRFSKQSI
ncbi:hypothetical protein AcW1_002481 [Taiwanofungus camphoratus]|nr:hypothetical protein AcW1_002481 [Antrodia cinnamomea]